MLFPLRKIIDEVSKVAKVRFKYIVGIYGVCGEVAGVVMEHMSNGSLNNLLASHTLMWPKKFQMVYEISMGVNFLHSMTQPIPHLNLKTSNVLLDDHLHAKVRGNRAEAGLDRPRCLTNVLLGFDPRFQISLSSAGRRA